MVHKIKIAFYLLVPPGIVGGIERSVYNLIKHLDKTKFDPYVVFAFRGETPRLYRSLGIKLRFIPRSPLKLAAFFKNEAIQIAQTNSYHADFGIAATAAGIPHVLALQAHEEVAVTHLTPKQRKDSLFLLTSLADKIICASHFIKTGFKKTSPFSKIQVVHNSVDLAQIRLPRPKYSARQQFKIAMVGHLAPQKRHLDFVRAAKRVLEKYPRAHFYIFGTVYASPRSTDYAKRLRQVIRDMGLTHVISFQHNYRNLWKALATMDMVVLPSEKEGFGMAVVEAMALGKPVIVAKSGALPEIVQDGIQGYQVPLKDPQCLAEAMLKLLDSPRKMLRMGKAARRRVEHSFDIQKNARQYEAVYQQLLKNTHKKKRKLMTQPTL